MNRTQKWQKIALERGVIMGDMKKQNDALEQQNRDLRAALEDWHNMFEREDFHIDFSNGVTHNGIDEGRVKGNAMLMRMLERTRQALGKEE